MFDKAAARWAELIVGDLPDFSNANNCDLFSGRLRFEYRGTVDDIVIGAQLEDFTQNDAFRPPTEDCDDPRVNGVFVGNDFVRGYCDMSRTVGSAGPTFIASGSTTRSTISGTMRFDRLNFKCCNGEMEKLLTILHEIGHILYVSAMLVLPASLVCWFLLLHLQKYILFQCYL